MGTLSGCPGNWVLLLSLNSQKGKQGVIYELSIQVDSFGVELFLLGTYDVLSELIELLCLNFLFICSSRTKK